MKQKNNYEAHGFTDRNEYIESLADDYGVDTDTVSCIADLLGEEEDFDGLINSLEDFI